MAGEAQAISAATLTTDASEDRLANRLWLISATLLRLRAACQPWRVAHAVSRPGERLAGAQAPGCAPDVAGADGLVRQAIGGYISILEGSLRVGGGGLTGFGGDLVTVGVDAPQLGAIHMRRAVAKTLANRMRARGSVAADPVSRAGLLLSMPKQRWGSYPVSAPAASRCTARSIRSTERSRPSVASDSKIPGDTEVPVIATRIGW